MEPSGEVLGGCEDPGPEGTPGDLQSHLRGKPPSPRACLHLSSSPARGLNAPELFPSPQRGTLSCSDNTAVATVTSSRNGGPLLPKQQARSGRYCATTFLPTEVALGLFLSEADAADCEGDRDRPCSLASGFLSCSRRWPTNASTDLTARARPGHDLRPAQRGLAAGEALVVAPGGWESLKPPPWDPWHVMSGAQ